MFNIELVHVAELHRVRAFYESVGYGGGASAADIVLTATMNERVIGAVRLCPEHGTTVLRGMFVAPVYQRRGVGRALLARCLRWLGDDEAYCLPYDHLAGFYEEAGFVPAPREILPPFLALRLDGYLSKNQRVLAMRRPWSGRVPQHP